MTTKIMKMLSNIIEHFITNVWDYSLFAGVALVLRWIYVVKGFDSFVLSLGLLLIFTSFINEYNSKK